MKPLFQPLYLPNASDQEKDLNPSWAQTMSSAFSLENDVVNVLDYITRPTFAPDANFNFKATFNEMKLPVEWMPLLAPAQSRQEFDATLGRIQKEYQNKAVLAASGWTGTMAALSAGMLSPTIFIPFAGQARGAKGFAEVLALAAAGAGAQNGALFLNQETRTEAELYTGIALDTLLMGMMGGAWLGLTGRARAKLTTQLPFKQEGVNYAEGAPDVPGRATEKTVQPELDTLILTPAMRIDDVLELTPDMRVYDLLRLTEQIRVKGNLKLTDQMRVDGPLKLSTPVREGALQLTQDMRAEGAMQLTPGMRVDGPLRLTPDMRVNGPYRLEDWMRTDKPFTLTGDMRVADLLKLTPDMEVRDVLRLTDEMRVRDDVPADVKTLVDEVRMGETTVVEAIPTSKAFDTQGVGAQVSRTRNTLGAKPAPNRVRQAAMDALGKMSPAYRMLTQRFFPSLRNGIAKLDMAGIRQAGLDTMEPSASGGTVIERIRGYDYYIVKLAKELDKNFLNYLYDGAKGIDFDSPAIAQIKSEFGKTPPGKLNWTEYKAAVFDGLNTGEFRPELGDSVRALREFFENYTTRQKQYLEEFRAAGIDVKPLFKELEGEEELGKGVTGYAHHIFDQNKLMDNMSEFLDDFTKAYERQLTEGFAKAQKRYAKRKQKLEFEKLIASMDESEISGRLADTEGDIEAIEQLPAWQGYRDGRLKITRQAKDEGWTTEKLKETMKAFEEAQPEDVKVLQEERKGLMSTAKSLKKFGGDSAEKTAKLQAEIAKLDEAISGMFREEMPAIERADLSIAAIQAKGDRMLAPVEKGIARVIKEMEKRRASLSKLLTSKRTNSASRMKVMEQLEKSKAKYADLLDRLSMVQGKQVALDERLSELNLIREDAVREANLLVRSRASRIEDLEDKLEEVASKPLTPEERARMGSQVDEELFALEQDFTELWGARRGEGSGGAPDTKTPDFTEKAREMATLLHQKLTNSEVALSPAYHALRQDARAAELLRVMKMPYDMKQKWLIKDVELVSRAYDRVMGPDLEIWRAFDGSVNAKSLLGEMQEEVTAHMMRIGTAKFVKLPKGWTDKAAKFSERVKKRLVEAGDADEIYLDAKNFSDTGGDGFVPLTEELRSQLGRAVTDAAKHYTEDLDVAIQRLRNTRGVPRDASSMWWRTGRFVKNMNVMTMMGGVTPASLSDIARPIWQHGIAKAYGHGLRPFISGLLTQEGKKFRVKAKEINRQIGLNLEPVLHGRAQGLFDLAEDSIGRTKLERAVNVGAQKMGLIALYDYWTAGMKGIAGNVTHATMAAYIPKVAEAWRKGVKMEGDLLEMQGYLRNLGLRDLDIHRIALQMERADGVEYFSNGGVLPNIKAWDDPAAYQAYQAAVLAEVNKLIVTPGLERPNVVDENMAYSMLFQFKSFVFGSNSRMAMSALQGNDPYLGQGLAFSLAFGALSYYTYAIAAGGKTWERANEGDVSNWIWESIKRSGIMGAMSIAGDAAERIPLVSGDDTNPLFLRPSGLLGTFLGPTYSQAERMADLIVKAGSDDPKQIERNMKSIRQTFIPFQNHFLWRQVLDRIGNALYGAN